MNSFQILLPVFALVFLTYFHIALNAFLIKKSIQNNELDYKWMKFTPSWQEIPNDIQSSRELYKNLFETPLIFYFYCLLAYNLDHVTILNLSLSWLFVFLRIWHYYVRLQNPKVSNRRPPFQYSVVVSFFLWVELLISSLK